MFNIALLLGPVAFRDFEIPSGINFGGAQRTAIHRLAGGARIIDSLGRDDANITFSGTFSGSDATLRARLVDGLRVTGVPLPLTWDVFFYTVIISEFQADYQNGSWIPYRLACTVLRDEASALTTAAVSVGADALADAGTALGFATSAGVDLAPAQAALLLQGATVRDTAAYVAARSAVAAGNTQLDQGITLAEGALNSLSPIPAGGVAAGVASLANAATAAEALATLTAARSYLGRTSVNLMNVGT